MTTDLPPAERWITGFPKKEVRPTVENWFAYVVRNRKATTPATVVAAVTALVGAKLSWAVETSSRERCNSTLIALRCDYQGALAYAQAILDAEGPP
jgi:hypothetical protein